MAISKTEITAEMFDSIFPACSDKVRDHVLPILNATMLEFGITNRMRAAAFLATLAVESGEFRYTEEIASGAAYEGRRDLGNTQPGDGKRFKGRGRIQNTGRDVYKACSDYFGVDLIRHPELMEQEPLATRSAGWFWKHFKTKMNEMADAGNFLGTQVKVNGRNRKTGKPNHWAERQEYYRDALRVIPTDFDMTKGNQKPAPVAVLPVVVDEPQDSGVDVPTETSTATITDAVITGDKLAPAESTQAVKTETQDASGTNVTTATVTASPISKSSLIVTIGTTVAGIISALGVAKDVIIGGIRDTVTANPGLAIYMLCAVIIIAIGLYFYDRAKERQTRRTLAVTNTVK